MGGSPDFKHQEASSIRWLLSPNLKGVSPVGGGGQMAQGKAAAYTKALRNDSEETSWKSRRRCSQRCSQRDGKCYGYRTQGQAWVLRKGAEEPKDASPP